MLQIAYSAGFFAGLFLLASAVAWSRVARRRSNDDLHFDQVRLAATGTTVAFALLGVALIVVVLDWLT